MRNDTLVNTQVTFSTVKLFRRIRKELEEVEMKKKRKRKRITKREICEELWRRCIIKKIV